MACELPHGVQLRKARDLPGLRVKRTAVEGVFLMDEEPTSSPVVRAANVYSDSEPEATSNSGFVGGEGRNPTCSPVGGAPTTPPWDWDNFPGGPTSQHQWEKPAFQQQFPSTANQSLPLCEALNVSKEDCEFWLEGGWRYSGGNQHPANFTNGWFTQTASHLPSHNAHFLQSNYPGCPLSLVPATDLSWAAPCGVLSSLSTWGCNGYFAPSSYAVPPPNYYFTLPMSTGGHGAYFQGPHGQALHLPGPFCTGYGSHFGTIPQPVSHLPTTHNQPTWGNSEHFMHPRPSSHVVPPSTGYLTPPLATVPVPHLQDPTGQVEHCPGPLDDGCSIHSNSPPRSETPLLDALSRSYSAASRPPTPHPSRGRKRILSEEPESESEAIPPIKRRCKELEAFLCEYGSQYESYGQHYPWLATSPKESHVPVEPFGNEAETTPPEKHKCVEMEVFLSEYSSQSECCGQQPQHYLNLSTSSKEGEVPGEEYEKEAETIPSAKRRCVEVDSSVCENSTQPESPDQYSRQSSIPSSPEFFQWPTAQPPDLDLTSPSSPASGFHSPPNSPPRMSSPNTEPKSLGQPVTHIAGLPPNSQLVGWRPARISLSAQILEKKAMAKAAKRKKAHPARRRCGWMGLKKFLLSRYLEEKELSS